MGGNTYKRKNFTNEELSNMIEMVIKNPLQSIRSHKILNNAKLWRADVSRLLDADSCKRFYFLLETRNKNIKCHHCQISLGIESYRYGLGFYKYCLECTKLEVWKSNVTSDRLRERAEKIKQSKLSFYQTDRGKQVAKQIGRKNSINMKNFTKTSQGKANIEKSRILNSKLMKEKILNGTFTPNSNNRNTHWDTYYQNKKYRSSWEALYQYFFPKDHYEKLRIVYTYLDKEYIYIVDFINYNTKIVTEVKPKELCCDKKFLMKLTYLKEWASKNGFTVRIADLDFLLDLGEPLDLQNFDENTQRKIKGLYAKAQNQNNQKFKNF